MTRKHYQMLARVIGEAFNGEHDARRIRERLISQLSRELSYDNPHFDKQRFEDAVEDART